MQILVDENNVIIAVGEFEGMGGYFYDKYEKINYPSILNLTMHEISNELNPRQYKDLYIDGEILINTAYPQGNEADELQNLMQTAILGEVRYRYE